MLRIIAFIFIIYLRYFFTHYIEYFYFILYTAILGVAANALTFTLAGSGVVQVRDNLIPKLLFWPAVLGGCFAVTLAFLY